MGLKKLSQAILLSLAVFAGAAELRAHAAPVAEVSPNLPIVQNRPPLQKKKFIHGFGAYLRHSARSLAGSFVSAVKTAQTDRALVLKKGIKPAKQGAHEVNADINTKEKQSHGQLVAIAACIKHEDLPRAESGARAAALPCFTAGHLTQTQLWNSIARPPNGLVWRLLTQDLGRFAPAGGAIASCYAAHACAEARLPGETWVAGQAAAITGDAMPRQLAGQSMSRTIPGKRSAAASEAIRAPQAGPAGAPAVSKVINPPLESSQNAGQAVAAPVLPLLG